MKMDEHVADLLPACALGCLEDEELARVTEHLARCESCRAELEQYRAVVEALPMAMVQHQPPARLKGRILEAVRQGRAPRKPALPWWRRLGFSVTTWAWVSLVLILALGLNNLVLWQRLHQVEARQRAGLMTVVLQGTPFSPGASGMLVISRDGEHGTLVVDGLPPLDESHQYQLWLIRNGERLSGGVFSVDARGYGSLWVSSGEPLIRFSAFGVTIEPVGGSPGPTGEKVLGGEL
jgi:anti-sigma-K factor RskA